QAYLAEGAAAGQPAQSAGRARSSAAGGGDSRVPGGRQTPAARKNRQSRHSRLPISRRPDDSDTTGLLPVPLRAGENDHDPTCRGRLRAALALLSCCLGLSAGGCAFGPKVLESSHGKYNESVREVEEEQLLCNLVRLRYNETSLALNIASIAAQYELSA